MLKLNMQRNQRNNKLADFICGEKDSVISKALKQTQFES